MFKFDSITNIRKEISYSKWTSLIKKPVIRNILLVMFITLFVKVIGFFKESIVASSFGLSELLDTFYISMLVPGFISNVFLNSFSTVFIPNYIAESKTSNNIRSFQTTAFLMVLGISLVFIVVAFLFTDVYINVIFPGHSPSYYQLIKLQFYFLIPCIVFWGISSLISGLLKIYDEFKYSSLNTVFIPISIIVCVLFYRESLGDSVLAFGTLIGSSLNLVFLIYMAIKKGILKFQKPDFKNENAMLMLKQLPAKASSGFFTGLIGVTDQFFAAQLVVGSIAALNYGSKIPAFITGLLILTLNSVLLPYFSKKVMENRKKAYSDLYKVLKRLFIVAGIITVIAIISSDWVVRILFERQEFTSEDTYKVSLLQKITLIYAPFTVCGMVLVNFLTSINKNKFMAYVALGSMILNFILDYLLMKLYGVYGIALCTTIIYIIRSLILLKYTVNQGKTITTNT